MKDRLVRFLNDAQNTGRRPLLIVLSEADAEQLTKDMEEALMPRSHHQVGPLYTWKFLGVNIACANVEASFVVVESGLDTPSILLIPAGGPQPAEADSEAALREKRAEAWRRTKAWLGRQ